MILRSELAEVRIYKIMWIYISKIQNTPAQVAFRDFVAAAKTSHGKSREVLGSLGESWRGLGPYHLPVFFPEDWNFRCRPGDIKEMCKNCTTSLNCQSLSQVPLAPTNPQPRHLRPVLSVADEGTRLLHQSSDQRPSHPICR